MKLLAVVVVIQGACLVNQVVGVAPSVSALITSMQDSFGGLSAQRDLWFENYSNLKRLAETDMEHLRMLLFSSKMVVPVIWAVYKTQIRAHKKILPRLAEGRAVLPYHMTISAPVLPYIHVEVTLLLHQEEDFQLEIFRDSQQIFHLNFDFEERRVALGDKDHEGKATERVVLEGETFPAIKLHEPFRIHVQVADDCIFTTIWPSNLNLVMPLPLPVKHIWCTKDYQKAENYTVNVDHGSASSHTAESGESIEDTQDSQEDNHDIELISAIIYQGMFFQ